MKVEGVLPDLNEEKNSVSIILREKAAGGKVEDVRCTGPKRRYILP